MQLALEFKGVWTAIEPEDSPTVTSTPSVQETPVRSSDAQVFQSGTQTAGPSQTIESARQQVLRQKMEEFRSSPQWTSAAAKKVDRTAFIYICSNVSEEQKCHVRDTRSALEAWNALKRIHEPNLVQHKFDLMSRLTKLRKEDMENMQTYISRTLSLLGQINTHDEQISSTLQAAFLLNGLPQGYSPLIMGLCAADPNITIDACIPHLLAEETRRGQNRDNKRNTHAHSSAMITNVRNDLYCPHHKIKGHSEDQCLHLHPELRRNPQKRKDQPKQKSGPPPQRRPEQAKLAWVDEEEEVVAVLAATTVEIGKNIYVSKHMESGGNRWAIDSGATRHMVTNINLLTNVRPLSRKIRVVIGDGTISNLIYVDDLVVFTKTDSELKVSNKLKSEISNTFKITDSGEISYILGLKVERNREKKELYLSQGAFISTVIHRFNMENCNPIATPMEISAIKGFLDSPPYTDDFPYPQCVGAINWLATLSRPDIAYTASQLCAGMAKSQAHVTAAKRCLRYLSGTADLVLRLGTTTEIIGYTDSDYAGDLSHCRSTGAYVFLIGGAVTWQSKRQPTVALSTTEAEYMAATQAAKESVWITAFLHDLHFKIRKPGLIYGDNQGSIKLALNSQFHGRTKHIAIQHHFIRDLISAKEVTLEYISTKEMIADGLTKALPRIAHDKLVHDLGLRRKESVGII